MCDRASARLSRCWFPYLFYKLLAPSCTSSRIESLHVFDPAAAWPSRQAVAGREVQLGGRARRPAKGLLPVWGSRRPRSASWDAAVRSHPSRAPGCHPAKSQQGRAGSRGPAGPPGRPCVGPGLSLAQWGVTCACRGGPRLSFSASGTLGHVISQFWL